MNNVACLTHYTLFFKTYGVRSLRLLHTITRYERFGGQVPRTSHTLLPYITPNGVRPARE